MIIARVLWTTMIIRLSTARLQFAIFELDDGSFEPLPKSKGLKTDVGEDAFAATPYALAVADGIGSCEFSSSFLARALVTKIGSSLTQLSTPVETHSHMDLTTFRRHLNKCAKDAINLQPRGNPNFRLATR